MTDASTQFEMDLLLDALRQSKSEVARLQAFHDDWAKLDGNSPGYNLEKAKTYGRIAAETKQQLEEATAQLASDHRDLHNHYMHLVNFANAEASRFQAMLVQERQKHTAALSDLRITIAARVKQSFKEEYAILDLILSTPLGTP